MISEDPPRARRALAAGWITRWIIGPCLIATMDPQQLGRPVADLFMALYCDATMQRRQPDIPYGILLLFIVALRSANVSA
jgi:hypothetical protein